MDAGERLVLLDALRGFALCGVFVSNVYMWFSGRSFIPRPQLEAARASYSLLDNIAMSAASFLVFGKFITIFSFLFGLGFAVQMGRAEARGASIVPLYARRLGVLFLLGVSHLFLLWYGDILSTYAVLGLGLLLFRKRSDKTLLISAGVFILVTPILGNLILQLPKLLAATPEAAEAVAKAATDHSTAIRAEVLEAISHGTWLDVARANAHYFLGDFFKPLLTLLLALLGRFLLGLMAGRRRLFHDAPQHLALFRKVLAWGLGFGMVGSGVGLVLGQLAMRKIINPQTLPMWFQLVLTPVRQLGEVGLAAFYVAAFVLLFQRPAWQRRLAVLAPVGRMALTNYLCQTVISLCLFYGYGLGLMGRFGPALLVALPVGIFVLQVGVSHLWLARFRFGPAEWLWRSLTYGKAQPMRRASGPVDVSVAPA